MKTTPPRSEGSNPSLSATTLKPDLRDQRDQTELEQWKQGLIQPIIRLMAKRGIVELHITRKAGTNGTFQFELVPDQETQDAPVFEVGAPYIFPMDRPSGYWCCVVTHESGIANYLNIHGKRWPHALNLTKLGRGKAVPLATYGVEVSKVATGLVFEQKQPSSALYDDGEPQRWQPEHPGTRERLLFLPRQPKSLRMDPKVLPKLLAWIDKNPNQLAQ